MGMGTAAPHYYTAEMVRALNAAEPQHWPRYETVYGELLVTTAPRWWHQEIVKRLAVSLELYLRRERVGHPVISPSEVSWTPDVLVQPDVFVVPIEQARSLDWTQAKTLLLAVEVLSPSTARADRFTKRKLYQQQGVALYWIVDGDDCSVEVWTPDAIFPRVERERLEWHPAGAREPFVLPLGELFAPV